MAGDDRRHAVTVAFAGGGWARSRFLALAGLVSARRRGSSPPGRRRPRQRPRVLDRGRARDLERRPERPRRDRGRDLHPRGDDVQDDRLPPLHEGLGAAAADDPNVVGDNDGIPGPLLRARVGDRILVHFKNLDNEFERPHSMHFHGVEYAVGSDGAFMPGFSGPGANVKPGESFTYRLKAGPDSAGIWPYHDHSPSMMDSIDGGLYGALSILGPSEEPPDREFVVFFGSQLDSTRSTAAPSSATRPSSAPARRHRPVGRARARRRLPHLPRARPPLALAERRRREDTRTIGPAESFAMRWKEDALGTWFYHCHVESHMMNGMIGFYRVGR